MLANLIIIFIGLYICWLPFAGIIHLIARLDMFLFILVREGEGAVITQGGEVTDLVLSFQSHKYAGRNDFTIDHDDESLSPDDKRLMVVRRDDIEPAARPYQIIETSVSNRFGRRLRFVFLMGGIRFIGFAQPKRYPFEWLSPGAIIADQPMTFQFHSENLSRFFTKPVVYAFQLTNVEFAGTAGATGILGQIGYVISGRMTNPFVAINRRQHWLREIQEVLEPQMYLLLGGFSFADLTGTNSTKKAELVLALQNIVRNNRKEIERQFGFKLTRIQTGSPEPAAGLREVTLQQVCANVEADVVRTRASGEADAITVIGTATASAARSLVDAYGNPTVAASVLIARARADAFRDFRGTTIVEGSDGQQPALILNTGAAVSPPRTSTPTATPPASPPSAATPPTTP
jgi:hypothetical protein